MDQLKKTIANNLNFDLSNEILEIIFYALKIPFLEDTKIDFLLFFKIYYLIFTKINTADEEAEEEKEQREYEHAIEGNEEENEQEQIMDSQAGEEDIGNEGDNEFSENRTEKEL